MADSDGLENRCPRKGTVGSNPTLSAKNRIVRGDLNGDFDTCPLRITKLLDQERD